MKAIMYHYVRQVDERFPNFRFLDVDNFKRQLDYFSSCGGFLTRDEWYQLVTAGEMPNNEDGHILTFDDAMSCHYNFVFKELLARKLWGIFYVPSAPYTDERRILDVHRVHLLCGAFDGSKLLNLALALISPEMITFEKKAEFQNNTYARQINAEGVTEFKRIVNYFLKDECRTELVDKIANSLDFTFPSEQFYVPESGLCEMAQAGMLLGSHTVNHAVMSKLTYEQQKMEIHNSLDFISSICSPSLRTYCHPFGGFHSFNQDTVSILQAAGVQFSFNVEPRRICAEDLTLNKHQLPRYDCNQFIHGAAS